MVKVVVDIMRATSGGLRGITYWARLEDEQPEGKPSPYSIDCKDREEASEVVGLYNARRMVKANVSLQDALAMVRNKVGPSAWEIVRDYED
jgi:hypothetical protein